MSTESEGDRGALIERGSELERIEGLLAEARSGHGSTLLIEGMPGIGKTALLDAARALAAKGGLRVLDARAAALEREVAFGVVRQLLEAPVRGVDEPGRRELFAGAARLAEGPLGPADRSDAEGSAGAALHGLYWLCANLADRGPVLVAVDDLHWADEPSVRFLSYLGRRVSEHPVLVCAASRPAPAEPDRPLLAALSGHWDEVLRLAPLSDQGVDQVVRETLAADAEPEFSAACARASGGNPFLLAGGLAALRADGIEPVAAEVGRVERLRPETLTHALLARLARLGPAATATAHALATLGGGAALRRVARLAELNPEAAAAAIDGLRGEGILASGPELEFVHPLVANAVEADLGEPARGLAQLRAAGLLQADGETPERIAPHLLAAEPTAERWVVDTLRASAAGALAKGAPEPAVAQLERALAEPPPDRDRATVLVELGQALGRAGRPEEGGERLREALELTEEPRARAEIAVELGGQGVLGGEASRVIAVLEDARRRLGDVDGKGALPLEVEIAFASHIAGKPAGTWLARLEAAAERASDGDSAKPTALAVLAYGAAGSGDRPADEVVKLASRASELGGTPVEGIHLMSFAAIALGVGGRWGRALELLDAEVEAAQAIGDAIRFSFISLVRSRIAFHAGRVREAEADARAVLDAYPEGPISLAFALGTLVQALVAGGRVEEAQAALTEHRLDATRELEVVADFVLLEARGGLRIAQGRFRDAVEDLAACGELLTRVGFTNPSYSRWRSDAALAHLALGELEAARRLAAGDLELARAFEEPGGIGIALGALGLIEGGERGIELLTESVSVLGRSESALELAHSQVALGTALRRAGRRREPREPLRRGLDIATRCGASSLAEQAREELVVAGGRPRRAALSGPESLTASELRVVRLAAEGKSNREIAQALFVTRRTVEVHLTSAYRKLEIESREELPTALEPVEA